MTSKPDNAPRELNTASSSRAKKTKSKTRANPARAFPDNDRVDLPPAWRIQSPTDQVREQDAISPSIEPYDRCYLDMLVPYIRAFFHLFAALHFWSSSYYYWFYVKAPVDVSGMGKTFGNANKFKFLSFWDVLLQAFFFTVCFLNDILGSNSTSLENIQNKTLQCFRKFQDMFMCCLAFPLSMFVGLTFWGLYFVDRELVFPKSLDAYFPWWLNHCMHTNIMIFILLEMYFNKRQYPSRKIGLTVLILFMLTYLTWVHYIFYVSGTWVYPVLHVLGLRDRIIFFVGLLLLATVLYLLGERLNENFWGKTTTQSRTQKAK